MPMLRFMLRRAAVGGCHTVPSVYHTFTRLYERRFEATFRRLPRRARVQVPRSMRLRPMFAYEGR
jgi:hypothetical protein